MPIDGPPTPPPTRARSASSEPAITLIEILIVMLIMAIMMGFAVSKFSGAKTTAQRKAGISVALQYKDAIDAFMADNGQQPPAIGVWNEWPAPVTRGPVDRLLRAPGGGAGFARYVKNIPEPVSDGLVSFQGSASSAPVQVTYNGAVGPGRYTLTVVTPKLPSSTCVISNGQLTPPQKPCT